MALNEGNFTRAIRSLTKRGLLVRQRVRATWVRLDDDDVSPEIDGRHWMITERGLVEAERLRGAQV